MLAYFHFIVLRVTGKAYTLLHEADGTATWKENTKSPQERKLRELILRELGAQRGAALQKEIHTGLHQMIISTLPPNRRSDGTDRLQSDSPAPDTHQRVPHLWVWPSWGPSWRRAGCRREGSPFAPRTPAVKGTKVPQKNILDQIRGCEPVYAWD